MALMPVTAMQGDLAVDDTSVGLGPIRACERHDIVQTVGVSATVEGYMNSLEALGLSSTIKELPLSPDQLHEYSLRARKVLLSLLHPDRGGKHDDFVRIEGATEPLKSRDGFDRALRGLNSSPNPQLLLKNQQLQSQVKDLEWRIKRQEKEIESLFIRLVNANTSKHSQESPKNSKHSQEWLNIEEAAERLHTSRDWLYRHWKELSFAVKLSPKQIRFSAKGIEEYLEEKQVW